MQRVTRCVNAVPVPRRFGEIISGSVSGGRHAVEYPDLAAMTAALTFLTTDPAARGWRRGLADLTDVQREWYLLEAK